MDFTRRRWLGTTLAAGASLPFVPSAFAGDSLRIATFRYDVTPPAGHPLCGGWITPAKTVADPLEAIGFVILGAGTPIVVCAVDWTGLLNEAHIQWRTALAEAAGTTPDRVAVQCVHQHDAPFACLASEALVAEQNAGLTVVDPAFFAECLVRGKAAVKEALAKAKPLTHVATAEATVERIASNRRVEIGPDGKVRRMRGSSCKVPDLIALPEGLIDPKLKTVAFYSEEGKVAACHYYACHPMSHYGRGDVSSDFAGLARKRMQAAEPGCTHLYFNGCGGNISAGKYNDGSPEARIELTDRLHAAMAEASGKLAPKPLQKVEWRTHDLLPEVNPVFTEEGELAQVRNPENLPANRIRPAMRVSWIRRIAAKTPIVLSALHLDEVSMLHLPAESFIEYQLKAQSMAPGRFVATAAYGDGGAWYVPVKEAYPQGGYEVSVANCAPSVDDALDVGIRELLA
ncbi:MAG TPA: hypothetical protein PLA50_09140 [Bacteroidia bacterium]|nr:hypothetical protein [Bacteroidia bacterium]